jgi:predicted Zn-ribbon and HTH transcriptional regulator
MTAYDAGIEPAYCRSCGIELNIDEQYEAECERCRYRDGEDMSQALTDFATRYHYAQTQSN